MDEAEWKTGKKTKRAASRRIDEDDFGNVTPPPKPQRSPNPNAWFGELNLLRGATQRGRG